MAKRRTIVGFDSEAAFERARRAILKIEGAPTNQRTMRRVPPVVSDDQNVRLFVVVESPWFTASNMGAAVATDLGIYVAAVKLPVVDVNQVPHVLLDIPTVMLSDEVFSEVYVTNRDGDEFPSKAYIAYGSANGGVGNRECDVTKLYCGPTLTGRPYRSQIVQATFWNGKWWMTGALNLSMWGQVVSATAGAVTVELGFSSDGGNSITQVMPPADSEYSENATMPVEEFSVGLTTVSIAAGDIVTVYWIGDRYYVIPAGCTEV